MKKIISLIFILIFTFIPVYAENEIQFLNDYFDIIPINIPFEYNINSISDNCLTAYQNDNYADNCTVLDFEGNCIIDKKFCWIGRFSDGIAPVLKMNGGKTGYVNLNGEYIIPPIFDSGESFSYGYAAVRKDGYSGYINTKGEFVKYFSDSCWLFGFEDGYAVVTDSINNKVTVYDTAFNVVFEKDDIDFINYMGCDMFSSAYFSDDEYTMKFFDNKGNEIFSDSNINGKFYGGKILSVTDDKAVLIDKSGKITAQTETNEFSFIERYAENINVASVNQDNLNYLIVYDDDFKEIGRFNENAYYFSYEANDTLLISDEVNKKRYLLKDKKESKNVSYVELPTEELPQNRQNELVLKFKIGESRAYINGEPHFIDDMSDYTGGDAPKIFIKDGRTMIPVRFLNDCFSNYANGGWYTDYNSETREVILTGEKQIKLTADSNNIEVTEFDFDKNDYKTTVVQTDIAPVISDGRTYVPIRFISEIMGYNVFYSDGIVMVGNTEFNSREIENEFSKAKFSLENYPKIDGSTATLPISYALTEKMLDISEIDAMRITHHTKTSNAYNRLINGEVDMLITGAPNAERIAKAAEKGVTFEHYDFALDGFVFMINKNNPIDYLSTQQIKDIYTGKITNWKETGGNDAEIIPFQRNEDSGSQSLMRNLFMKGEKMIEPKMNQINAMGEIIDMVAEFDNAENSLGYTVYYYLSEMHERDEVKPLGVDGVIPTDDTIRNGEYPYIIQYSIVIRNDEPEDSPVRKIIEFLKSDEGKELVKKTGFVNTNE